MVDGQAFADGLTYGMASAGAYGLYATRNKAQQYLQAQRAAQEPTTMLGLAREHATADHLLAEPSQQPTNAPAPFNNEIKN